MNNQQLLLQIALWLLLYVLLLLYSSLPELDNWSFAFGKSTIPMLSYLAVVYLNAQFVWSAFRSRQQRLWYVILSIGLLVVVGFARMTAEYYWLNRFLAIRHFYDFSSRHIIFTFVTLLVAYFFGILLQAALDYMTLLKKQEEIKSQQLQAELTLLKAQVQPHFLFNTLNNIYYLAYRKSDQTVDVIAKLAELMRYFQTESVKEWVPLTTEIQFIRDYIELETIRIPNGLRVDWCCEGNPDSITIPPMLLMPLVENIFKHGVDKSKSDNWTQISLFIDDTFLRFETRNPIALRSTDVVGTGLTNLAKRLTLLYGSANCLTQQQVNNQYVAQLQLPLFDYK
ncbi:histidine kinase [Spirosoma sp. BT702]|uniref:Histidine kinase n=1 Tax=Spirosoma profusum TaxID=2771354 RepID=A0A927AWQ9_9BACT|nr:histidine kinase [Spirosoma profusum]MBD2705827.1 histidine kinase [Spirosoma profusum]